LAKIITLSLVVKVVKIVLILTPWVKTIDQNKNICCGFAPWVKASLHLDTITGDFANDSGKFNFAIGQNADNSVQSCTYLDSLGLNKNPCCNIALRFKVSVDLTTVSGTNSNESGVSIG